MNQGTYPGPVGRSTKSHETTRTKRPFPVGSCFFVSVRGSCACVRLLSTLAGILFQQPARVCQNKLLSPLSRRSRGGSAEKIISPTDCSQVTEKQTRSTK